MAISSVDNLIFICQMESKIGVANTPEVIIIQVGDSQVMGISN
jgi:hypothetical protein